MENRGESNSPWVLLTGATGFIGQCLLGELLDRGHRILCVVRGATPGQARGALAAALKPWGRDPEPELERGRLAVLRGDLHRPLLGISEPVVRRMRGAVTAVIHAAGSTAFRKQPDGEPARTNVEGTREVFHLARAVASRNWHLISTAYVCGQCDRAEEQPTDNPPEFRNDYEHSKWTCERESLQAAAECGAALTIYRPSVVVGHSSTGVATRFAGVYYFFRAASLMARAAEQRQDVDRRRIPLRIPADPEARVNLVFVDDLARDFADLFDHAEARGGIYHLTHPAPPTNMMIKQAVEEFYDIGGGSFIGAGATVADRARSTYEEMFVSMTGVLSPYIFESPVFDRTAADRFIARRPAPWTPPRLRGLMRYAESVSWRPGGRAVAANGETDGVAPYFERFLPEYIPRSSVSRVGQLDLDVRFRIDGDVDGDWWCRFRRGELVDVRRTGGRSAQVVYGATPAAFWRAVGGEVSGPELFLSGDAQVEGDIERGLKFAMILQEFVREFPCRRARLISREVPSS